MPIAENLLSTPDKINRRKALRRFHDIATRALAAGIIFEGCGWAKNDTADKKVPPPSPTETPLKGFNRIKDEWQDPIETQLAETFSDKPVINPADWKIPSVHVQVQESGNQKKFSVYIPTDSPYKDDYEKTPVRLLAYFCNSKDEPILQTTPGIKTHQIPLDGVDGYPDSEKANPKSNKLVYKTDPVTITTAQQEDLEKNGMIIRIQAPVKDPNTIIDYGFYKASP